MASAPLDLSNLLKGIPTGAWVAISEREHRVMAFGAELKPVLKESEEKGEPLPLIVRANDLGTTMFL
jgi:hypothetical protein